MIRSILSCFIVLLGITDVIAQSSSPSIESIEVLQYSFPISDSTQTAGDSLQMHASSDTGSYVTDIDVVLIVNEASEVEKFEFKVSRNDSVWSSHSLNITDNLMNASNSNSGSKPGATVQLKFRMANVALPREAKKLEAILKSANNIPIGYGTKIF